MKTIAERKKGRRFSLRSVSLLGEKNEKRLRLHPLFWVVGIVYAFTGNLFLFFVSALVAIQHECAHAFAAAKLGYKLNRIILMPYGAIIDGDLRGISFKDEIFVALCGPLCNLATALFFVALWWIKPDLYPYTDVACYASLAIAVVNLIPAYPLDGGRILQCALARLFSKTQAQEEVAERKAKKVCKLLSLACSVALLGVFFLSVSKGTYNFSLLMFGAFLFLGCLGGKNQTAVYDKMQLSCTPSLLKGVEIKRIAVSHNLPMKDVLRFLSKGHYLVLEVYDDNLRKLFDLPQNRFSDLFALAPSPYTPLKGLEIPQNPPNL